ncbi:MAG: sugar transferase [Candidatus Auribacterota bacterium]|jgi:lipopolysaccharide/colanic/teichoic acid biosynthesis glycosyltransferase|nr:sugar transferase [Candidatus Auribacterota bacterium]
MPEPTSMILLGGGLCGMTVRLAKRCFEQTKRIADILLSLLFLTVLSPAAIAIAIAIKANSPGPIIFNQIRVGKHGKLFSMYKFRSMLNDTEKSSETTFTGIDNDPRITSIGKFIRRTHLDEIPQFFNVIKGDMSIIGPRPERPHYIDSIKRELPDYQLRLSIRPGITGLAQISLKYDESIDDVRRKLHYDLKYIKGVQNKCWSNEFRIMFQTFLLVITGKIIR